MRLSDSEIHDLSPPRSCHLELLFLLIRAINQYFGSTYCDRGVLPGAGDMEMEKAGEVSVQMGDRTSQVPNKPIGPDSMHGSPVKVGGGGRPV